MFEESLIVDVEDLEMVDSDFRHGLRRFGLANASQAFGRTVLAPEIRVSRCTVRGKDDHGLLGALQQNAAANGFVILMGNEHERALEQPVRHNPATLDAETYGAVRRVTAVIL